MNLNENVVHKPVLANSYSDSAPDIQKELKRTLEGIAIQITAVAADMSFRDSLSLIANFEDQKNWIKKAIKIRKLRGKFLPYDLFADPAWDILLDLTLAKMEDRSTSISSVCIAASVPNTTALRWLKSLIDVGAVHKIPDKSDKRRHFVELSDDFYESMLAFVSKAIKHSASKVV
jgi:hypothetical protein